MPTHPPKKHLKRARWLHIYRMMLPNVALVTGLALMIQAELAVVKLLGVVVLIVGVYDLSNPQRRDKKPPPGHKKA